MIPRRPPPSSFPLDDAWAGICWASGWDEAPCSHLSHQGPLPLDAPVPATLTWISFSARSSCRGSLLLTPQLPPGPEMERGVWSPCLPWFCPPPNLQQLRARSWGFTLSPSPPTVTTVLRATGVVWTPSPHHQPRQHGWQSRPQHYLQPGGVPWPLARTPPARPVGTHAAEGQ